MTTRADLPIEGMTCAACVNRVSKGLTALDGVDSADVNLATHQATVRYAPARVDPGKVKFSGRRNRRK